MPSAHRDSRTHPGFERAFRTPLVVPFAVPVYTFLPAATTHLPRAYMPSVPPPSTATTLFYLHATILYLRLRDATPLPFLSGSCLGTLRCSRITFAVCIGQNAHWLKRAGGTLLNARGLAYTYTTTLHEHDFGLFRRDCLPRNIGSPP